MTERGLLKKYIETNLKSLYKQLIMEHDKSIVPIIKAQIKVLEDVDRICKTRNKY